jgi:hemolysin III
MSKHYHLVTYSTEEERLNRLTHGLGLLASCAGLVLLVIAAAKTGDPYRVVSCSIFGTVLTVFYLVSTLYHSVHSPKVRSLFRTLDHASIFVVIAATYTPFVLVTLRSNGGWSLFGIVWGLAVAGVVFKSFATHKFGFLAPVLYVAMGWLIVVKINTLLTLMPEMGVFWLFAGGVTYTLGLVFYAIDRIPCNHAIWHLFVLGGSFCHFMAIYHYVI